MLRLTHYVSHSQPSRGRATLGAVEAGERGAGAWVPLVVPATASLDEAAVPRSAPAVPASPREAAGRGEAPAVTASPDEAAELNELVHALLHALRRDAAERFGPAATTPGQQRLLRALQRAGGPRRLGELAQMLDVAPRSITAKVDQAEADGQVRRVPDPADRRATLVELTPAGRDILAQVSAERSVGAAERLARLAPDERAQLLRLLRVVASPVPSAACATAPTP